MLHWEPALRRRSRQAQITGALLRRPLVGLAPANCGRTESVEPPFTLVVQARRRYIFRVNGANAYVVLGAGISARPLLLLHQSITVVMVTTRSLLLVLTPLDLVLRLRQAQEQAE